VKLPELIRHLQEHRQTDPSMSLMGFLQLHYTADHPADNDEDDDDDLPFKDPNTIGHLDTSVSSGRTEHRSCPEFPVITTPIIHPEGMPTYRANAVFHPPKA